jgi:hypothetical protein
MSKAKPAMQIRKPSTGADADKVREFIAGGSDAPKQGSAGEATETDRIAIYFDRTTAKRLRMYCAEQGRPMSRVVDDIVSGALADWTPDF